MNYTSPYFQEGLMISIHKVLFPGIAGGILFMVFFISMVANPTIALASGSAPAATFGAAPVTEAGIAAVGAAVNAGVAANLSENIGQQAQPTATPAASEQQQSSADTSCLLNQAYPEAIRQWCGQIERYASENGVEPNLLAAVMLQESGGNPDAYSKSGAVGLMQVMPRDGLASGFMCINGPCFSSRPSTAELYNPDFNISYGAKMLAELIQKYGNVREALMKYGPMNMGYRYADIILSIMNNHQ
jgi:soluble lytic murein transglycosylase-like protein